MTKRTAKSYDMCATGAMDGSAHATNTAGAGLQNVATAAHDAGNASLLYVTGILVTSTAPAATVSGLATLAGLAGGTMSLYLVESSTVGGVLDVTFEDPIPTTGTTIDAVLTVPTIASGGSTTATILYYKRPE